MSLQGRYYTMVRGWAHTRKEGGVNQITLKEEVGQVACLSCIDRKKAGVDIDQMSLLD